MNILVLDNYDSFTYNLVQLVQFYLSEERSGSGAEHQVLVKRNDQITIQEVASLNIDRVIISPGPGDTTKGGISKELIKLFFMNTPILGVCLGHQIIADYFGSSVVMSHTPTHGKTSSITHTGTGIFKDVASPTIVCRYHSLIVDPKTVPDTLSITAYADDGTIMGLQHKIFPVFGIQFHPESFLTPDGTIMIRNFIFDL